VLNEETAGLDEEYERLDAMARADTPATAETPLLALHEATVGQAKLMAHVIVIAERREESGADQNTAFDRMKNMLQDAGDFLGSDGDTIVIVGGEEDGNHADAIITGMVRADDEYAALLVDPTRSGRATVLFNGMTNLEVGQRVDYTVGDAWKAEEDPAEQAAS